ncbi:hypothetical protein [Fodinibius sediminis]|uniref:7-cyano-7-deazaguanine synthase n=1 Tax=Fodinibius sediminis TaxID=1214077 RepID=A0A521B2Z5_9BACT|nr:hypothetical protein [Fodinibius sediminis]SMO41477.1 hypothetical protein SAMN06265218_102149 [Fodinibius sediminis]
MESATKNTTLLLWTGGYDSTFRLLQLLFLEKREVQPLYVLDLSHRSPIHELQAMNEIRGELTRGGMVGELLKQTIYIDISEIQIDHEISNAWRRLRKERHVGRQYVWFASLCKQYGLREVELSIEADNEDSVSESIVDCLDTNSMAPDVKTIFQYFTLPIIDLTRQEMQKIAEREDWLDLLDLTWFCHHPIYHPFKKGIPCGVCNPCRIAIEEGAGHRIPWLLRFGGKYLKKIYHSPVVNLLNK